MNVADGRAHSVVDSITVLQTVGAVDSCGSAVLVLVCPGRLARIRADWSCERPSRAPVPHPQKSGTFNQSSTNQPIDPLDLRLLAGAHINFMCRWHRGDTDLYCCAIINGVLSGVELAYGEGAVGH